MGIKSEEYGVNDSQMGKRLGISVKGLEDTGRAEIVKPTSHELPKSYAQNPPSSNPYPFAPVVRFRERVSLQIDTTAAPQPKPLNRQEMLLLVLSAPCLQI